MRGAAVSGWDISRDGSNRSESGAGVENERTTSNSTVDVDLSEMPSRLFIKLT